jgi:hypothetical protein
MARYIRAIHTISRQHLMDHPDKPGDGEVEVPEMKLLELPKPFARPKQKTPPV